METEQGDTHTDVSDSRRGNQLTESVRFRTTKELKAAWDEMLSTRSLSQQDAALALFKWITSQDGLTQAMILGQVPDVDHAELAKIVLKKLATRAAGRKRAAD